VRAHALWQTRLDAVDERTAAVARHEERLDTQTKAVEARERAAEVALAAAERVEKRMLQRQSDAVVAAAATATTAAASDAATTAALQAELAAAKRECQKTQFTLSCLQQDHDDVLAECNEQKAQLAETLELAEASAKRAAAQKKGTWCKRSTLIIHLH
jgi:hypothetical protein